MLRRYNKALQIRLQNLLKQADIEEIRTSLAALSVAEFRTAGYMLGEDILPEVPEADYWRLFLGIVPSDSKAYLGTFLKAGVKRYQAGRLSIDGAALEAFARCATLIDRRKTLDAFLPILQEVEEVEVLIRTIGNNDLAISGQSLLRAETLPCYYTLFMFLRTAEADIVRQYALLLIRRGTPLAFKLVGVLRCYFDLENLPGTFSLHLESYKLSRLELGYEYFVKTLNS